MPLPPKLLALLLLLVPGTALADPLPPDDLVPEEVEWFCGKVVVKEEKPPGKEESEPSTNVTVEVRPDECVEPVVSVCEDLGLPCCEVGDLQPCQPGSLLGPMALWVGQGLPTGHHVCLRVGSDGDVHVTLETSPCWTPAPS